MAACSVDGPERELTVETRSALVTVMENRSLAVTDVAVMSAFSFEEILGQLITQAGVTGQTPLQLFRAWVATNNVCSEVIGGTTVPNSFNGFPFSCRPNEEARDQEPFSGSGEYKVTGLFNRFDLAPANGADCGEYRIVVTRTDVDPVTRKSLIFEAKLPNPQPASGLEGCRPVAQFWADLSSVASSAERAARLRTFYLTGLPGFAPVVHINHFQRLAGSGRVRTNSFLGGGPWSLREYGLRRVCSPTCSLVFVQQPTGDNPFWALSGSPTGHPLATSFQDWFIASLQVGQGLLATDVNRLIMNTPEQFLMGESQLPENIGAPTPPPRSLADELSPEFASRIQTRLTALGVTLTPAQLINRADSTTCTGCHRSANGDDVGFAAPFPSALPFRQTERLTMTGPDGDRFRLSDALLNVFLPFRKANLEQFVNQPPAGNTPCAGLCTNPIVFSGPHYQSGNLGTAVTCHQTAANLASGNCGNFAPGRTFKINNTTMSCTGVNLTLPPKRNGGYCFQASAGNYPWAYFTTW
jgi:hypothetical protein